MKLEAHLSSITRMQKQHEEIIHEFAENGFQQMFCDGLHHLTSRGEIRGIINFDLNRLQEITEKLAICNPNLSHIYDSKMLILRCIKILTNSSEWRQLFYIIVDDQSMFVNLLGEEAEASRDNRVEEPTIFFVHEENGLRNVYNLAGMLVYSKSINRNDLKYDLAKTLKKKYPERISLLFEND